MSTNREKIITEYTERKNTLLKILDFTNDVVNGKTESQACKEYGFQPTNVRRFFNSSFFKMLSEGKNIESELMPIKSWEDEFLEDLFNAEVVPDTDFREVYERHTTKLLSEREKQMLDLRYIEGLTLEQVGKEIGISGSRVRELIRKCHRKLSIGYVLKDFCKCAPIKDISLNKKFFPNDIIIDNGTFPNQTAIDVLSKETLEKSETSTRQEEASKDNRSVISIESARQIPITDLKLSTRAMNVLYRNGITDLAKLLLTNEEQLYIMRNLGTKSLKEIISEVQKNYSCNDWPVKPAYLPDNKILLSDLYILSTKQITAIKSLGITTITQLMEAPKGILEDIHNRISLTSYSSGFIGTHSFDKLVEHINKIGFSWKPSVSHENYGVFQAEQDVPKEKVNKGSSLKDEFKRWLFRSPAYFWAEDLGLSNKSIEVLEENNILDLAQLLILRPEELDKMLKDGDARREEIRLAIRKKYNINWPEDTGNR